MTVFIALLRAVNVGGTGRLPMKELKSACQQAGLTRVATHLASGNLVFETAWPRAEIELLLADLLEKRFGLTGNRCFVRAPEALAAALAANPFAGAAAERPQGLMLGFLGAAPDPVAAAAAFAGFAGPERLHLDGEHLYIDYPEGMASTTLTPAWLDRALRVPLTLRNWNTASKLLQMARALTE